MALTFVDVWGRYIFIAPVPGGVELTELMMAALIFAGLTLVMMEGEHIIVDLADFSMSWMLHGRLRPPDVLGVLKSSTYPAAKCK